MASVSVFCCCSQAFFVQVAAAYCIFCTAAYFSHYLGCDTCKCTNGFLLHAVSCVFLSEA